MNQSARRILVKTLNPDKVSNSRIFTMGTTGHNNQEDLDGYGGGGK